MKNKSFIFIVIIVILIFGGIYYIVNSSVKKESIKSDDTIIDIEKKSNPYVGGYKTEIEELYDEETGEKYYVYLTIRNDGTYTYGNNTYSGARKVGTYELNENTITLHDIVSFGSDSCFATSGEELKDYIVNIIDEKTLELTDDNKIFRFVYDRNLLENVFETSWYVTNPIDGTSPEISDVDEFWTLCTN